jgi:uncharacterized protein (DUF2147 family)
MITRSKFVCAAIAFAAFFAPVSAVLAADDTPAGRWVTIDDKDGSPRSVIEIADAGGVLEGRIVKIYDRPGHDSVHICKRCDGALKDKPVIGMTIINGLKRDGDGWDGGTIFDPSSGRTYSAEMHMADAGHKLVVRGYYGISLIGRSQTWIRESAFK